LILSPCEADDVANAVNSVYGVPFPTLLHNENLFRNHQELIVSTAQQEALPKVSALQDLRHSNGAGLSQCPSRNLRFNESTL
jgi:hypothetical protein